MSSSSNIDRPGGGSNNNNNNNHHHHKSGARASKQGKRKDIRAVLIDPEEVIPTSSAGAIGIANDITSDGNDIANDGNDIIVSGAPSAAKKAGKSHKPRNTKPAASASSANNVKSSTLKASAPEFIPSFGVPLNDTSESVLSPDHCLICANNIQYYAVGRCDHHICSLCALRLRSKNNDKTCPICKQDMSHMIVFAANRGKQLFDSFGLPDDTVVPGVDLEHHSHMLFVDCKAHYREMTKMRAICCPCFNCESRFPSEQLLQRHLGSAHDLTMCTLCLENRPLFISEQRLYSKQQLQAHLNSAPGSMTGAGGDKAGGHPLCKFCNERFYDTPALYKHMRTRHVSCHLCPAEHQSRYYREIEGLYEHIRNRHLVCDLCDPAEALANGTEYGFRNEIDLAAHMLHVHREVRNNRKIELKFNFHRADQDPTHRIPYVDLDFSSSDPNMQWRNHRASNSSSKAQSSASSRAIVDESSEEWPAVAPQSLIPSNMRIAGRVTGSGRFQRTAEDDALQAAADAVDNYAQQVRSRGNLQASEFPELSTAVGVPTAHVGQWVGGNANQSVVDGETSHQVPSSIPPKLHPLSTVNKRQQDVTTERQQKQVQEEQEQRRVQRNLLLAAALDVDTHILDNHSKAASIALSLVVAAAGGLDNYQGTSGAENQQWEMLKRPLFSLSLLQWARKNKLELQKVEKKLYDLIIDVSQTSAQLKPMPAAQRYYIHVLAQYYGVSCNEYDHEPKRYISLVKSADSALPSMTLSASASAAVRMPIHPVTAQLPILYFTVQDHAFAKSSLRYLSHQTGSTNSTPVNFTVAEMLGFMTRALASGENVDDAQSTARSASVTSSSSIFLTAKVVTVNVVSSCTASVEFEDILSAFRAWSILTAYTCVFAVNSAGSASVKVPSLVNVLLTDLFQVTPAFDPKTLEISGASLLDAQPILSGAETSLDWRHESLARQHGDSRKMVEKEEDAYLPIDATSQLSIACAESTDTIVLNSDLLAAVQQEWSVIEKDEVEAMDPPAASKTRPTDQLLTQFSGLAAKFRESFTSDPENEGNDGLTDATSSSASGYKPLKLKPRSSDLPPPLPPMTIPPVTASHPAVSSNSVPDVAPVSSSSMEKKKKSQKSSSQMASAVVSSKGNKYSMLGESDEEDERVQIRDSSDRLYPGGDTLKAGESAEKRPEDIYKLDWKCPVCTFINSSSSDEPDPVTQLLICEMCETPIPIDAVTTEKLAATTTNDMDNMDPWVML